jgi:uncharacterized membrane protein YjjP (DUF1212 family)
MTADERPQLILAFARVLYVNGQATEQTLSAAERLARVLGLRATILPHWGALDLLIDDKQGILTAQVAADPAGVEMDRVASAMRAIDAIEAGRLTPGAAMKNIAEISRSAPAPTWLFALAAAAGAVALAVIFGIQHISAAALIFVSAGAGAFLRRGLGRLSTNLLLPPFCAAVLAGIVGALAVRYDLSSSLRLVAVCPCMVLVPGPHFLNGALDLINGRISLGAARLIYAGLIVVAILAGLLLGLALLGVSLPTDPTGRAIPLWQDVIAAGVAVAAYSVFFSTPLYMLPWPVAVGMFAHALRWAVYYAVWFRRGDRRLGRLRGGRADPHSGFAAIAHAVCRHRLRFRRVDDARRLPVQDGQRSPADCERLADDIGYAQRDHCRRPERCHDHPGDELWSHRSEVGCRLSGRPSAAGQTIGSERPSQRCQQALAGYNARLDPRRSGLRGAQRASPGMRVEEKFSCRIKLICPVQSSSQKDSGFPPPQITSISVAIPSHFEGRIAIVTDVGTGCGGRKRRQRRGRLLADGEVVWS